ncbi:S1/P1 nuclease [Robertkochia aurantiaca]|uniref:S1/P1 nuclease n=1 Tax=Robertkochia aurantiaca TaxID=2873700 RepID=UPI001CCE3771|nr:S1/P1 nuclease [Robertkochia sp. 3YJGBD-33]
MKYIVFLMLSVFSFNQINAGFSVKSDSDWGRNGHRIVGEIASRHLDRRAAKKIDALLDGASLAKVSTYADEIKSDDRYNEFYPWHYVNYPLDAEYIKAEAASEGDLYQGIDRCIEILKNPASSKEDKVFYLKMLVHLVGDLHQPLHLGRSEDKGGNDIQVRWFGDGANLHSVWDTRMIEQYGMSYSELADNLPVLGENEKKVIMQGDHYLWGSQMRELTAMAYNSAEPGEKLGYEYMYNHFGTVQDQLQKAGLRLAAILNDIF